MIEWCPPPPWGQGSSPWVHVTWVSSATAYYSHSEDGGQTWDDPAVVVPSFYPFGTFRPALRAGPQASAWVCKRASSPEPRELECAVSYDPPSDWEVSSVDWGGVRKFPVSTALSTTSERPMVYMVTTYYAAGDGQSRLVFWAFDHAVPNAIVHHTMVLTTRNAEFDFEASLDYSPGDKVHVVYRDPDGAVQYFTWHSPLTPDQIRGGAEPNWQGPYRVSEGGSTQEPGSQPFIDVDGEAAFCVWRGRNQQGADIGEIYRAELNLNQWPPDWIEQQPVSSSPDFESNHPQCYTRTTVVWQEEVDNSTYRTEIWGKAGAITECISNAPELNNWWPQASVRNPVPPDPWVVRCHTLWSQEPLGGGQRFIHYKRHSFIPTDGAGYEYPTYLKPLLGQPKASPYCLERDGHIEYRDKRVDYGRGKLAYNLPYLNPSRDYLAQFTLYNGESLPITQAMKFEGTTVATMTLRPGVCETLFAYIPRSAYKTTRARLEVTRLKGPFACLAQDVRVYETYRAGTDDGARARATPLARVQLSAQPNPFEARCVLSLGNTSPGGAVTVFDASGRLVRRLRTESRPGSGTVAVWDGVDSQGKVVPAGVYTCMVDTRLTLSPVKVVRR